MLFECIHHRPWVVWAMLLAGCDFGPVEVRFLSRAPEGRQDPDGLRDAAAFDGSQRPANEGDAAIAFSPGPVCDDFPNDCKLEGRTKCTLVSANPGYISSCVPARGDLVIGASCQREQRGNDDCASGGFCTPLGRGFEEENRLICRQLCGESAECPAGKHCLQLYSAEPSGVCVETCTLFADEQREQPQCGSDDLRCVVAADTEGGFFGYCEIYGDQDEGEPCTLSSQCDDGLGCEESEGVCRFSCDADHPCPSDRRCLPLELGNLESLRLCVP